MILKEGLMEGDRSYVFFVKVNAQEVYAVLARYHIDKQHSFSPDIRK